MVDSLAVLLRVPERGDQSPHLERPAHNAGTGLAAVPCLVRIPHQPDDRRNTGFRPDPAAIRTSAARGRRSRTRRANCGNLHRARRRRSAHTRPRLLAVSGTPHPRSTGDTIVAVPITAIARRLQPRPEIASMNGRCSETSVHLLVSARVFRPGIVRSYQSHTAIRGYRFGENAKR